MYKTVVLVLILAMGVMGAACAESNASAQSVIMAEPFAPESGGDGEYPAYIGDNKALVSAVGGWPYIVDMTDGSKVSLFSRPEDEEIWREKLTVTVEAPLLAAEELIGVLETRGAMEAYFALYDGARYYTHLDCGGYILMITLAGDSVMIDPVTGEAWPLDGIRHATEDGFPVKWDTYADSYTVCDIYGTELRTEALDIDTEKWRILDIAFGKGHIAAYLREKDSSIDSPVEYAVAFDGTGENGEGLTVIPIGSYELFRSPDTIVLSENAAACWDESADDAGVPVVYISAEEGKAKALRMEEGAVSASYVGDAATEYGSVYAGRADMIRPVGISDSGRHMMLFNMTDGALYMVDLIELDAAKLTDIKELNDRGFDISIGQMSQMAWRGDEYAFEPSGKCWLRVIVGE